jgi:glycosyltransferase involved in cell wall biosynthesis
MLPLKLLEYVGMGIPSIVSETETIKSYFNDQMVRFCKPGDDRELAEAILELYRDPKRRAQLVANASTFNSSFNWEQQKKKYFDVVDSVLEARRN